MEPPELANNIADHQRLDEAIRRKLGHQSMQMGLKIIQSLPDVLRAGDYKITATVGLRRDIAEVMNVEPGDTSADNFIAVVDMGTTTIVAHLVEAHTMKTVDAKACFNSQGIYGREVTRRMITAEQKGVKELQRLLVEDINGLITSLADANHVKLKDITAVVCAGNTAMGHFLLALNPRHIRRFPYVPASVSPPPLRAAEVGLKINPRGLLYSLPGISGWVGSDTTAGILYTRMNEKEELALLLDIGTNGEIVIGHKEWLVATAASAGPALEGASVDCGMRAERGAVERVYAENGAIRYRTIDDAPRQGHLRLRDHRPGGGAAAGGLHRPLRALPPRGLPAHRGGGRGAALHPGRRAGGRRAGRVHHRERHREHRHGQGGHLRGHEDPDPPPGDRLRGHPALLHRRAPSGATSTWRTPSPSG